MQSRRTRAIISIGAIVGCTALSVHADINGLSGFSGVNINAPTPNSIGISGNSYLVTDGQNGEASSAWDANAQSIGAFTVSYTYQTAPQYTYAGNGGYSLQADGAAIAFQNPTTGSTSALGGGGSDLGYGGISTTSAAIGFELFNGYYNYQGGSELLTGGAQGSVYDLTNNVDLSTGDTVNVRLSYAGNTLTQSVADLSTGNATVMTYTGVNLASILGSSTALVGITGGTGGFNSTQTVSDFKFSSAAGSYTPLQLTGFNQKVIVPAGASDVDSSITATAGAGTSKGDYTFFEEGYPGSNAGTGLPASGSTFVSQNDAQHVFQMQSYANNSALQLDTGTPSGTLSLTTPVALGGLSILLMDGNGTAPFNLTVNFANGSSEVINGLVSSDWFDFGNTDTIAYVAGARIDDSGVIDNDGSNPNLYQLDVPLTDQTDPISSLTFDYAGSSTSSELNIYAVSGIAVPEPASLSLLGLGAISLLQRRRKTR